MSTDLRVLLLEDRPSDVELILHELRYAGFNPDWRCVDNEADYQAQLDQDYQIILADYSLPQFNALQALRLLQAAGLDIPFIVVTGSISEEAAVECMREGAADYLIKDRLARLGQAITHALHEKALRDENLKAEATLRKSEARYRALIESQRDLISRYLPDCTLTFVNDAYCQFYGKTREELIGSSLLSMVAPEFHAQVRKEAADMVKDPRPVRGEFLNYGGDGKEYWIQWVIQGVVDENGQVGEIQAVGRDVTRLKQVEAALRESEARFRTLAESTAAGIAIVQNGRLVYANPAISNISGASREGVIDTGIWEYIQPQFLQMAQERLSNFQEGEDTPTRDEIAFQTRQGETRWLDVTAGAAEIDGQPSVIVTTFDITERKQAEEALRASEEQFRIVFRESLDVIMIIDGDTGQILKVNPAVKRVLGFEEAALLERHFSILIPPGAPLTQEDFLRQLRVHEAVFEALRFFRADGTTCPMDLTATLIPWGKGTAVLATFRDVTERDKRERELESIVAVTTVLRDLPRTGTARAEILPLMLEQPANLLKAEGTALITRHSESGDMVVERGGGAWAAWTGAKLSPGETVFRRVIETGQPHLDNDAWAIPDDQFHPPQRLAALACIPLITQEHIIGALCVGRQQEINREEFHLLTVIGDIIANALQRTEAMELLEQRVAQRTAELAAANERLQELDKLKSKFVSEVSHELRTPITNLGMRVYLLEHDKPEKQEEHLESLKNQVKRLKSLIESILDLSRLEMAADRVIFAPVNLNTVIEPVFSAHLPRAGAAGLELRFEAKPDLPPVWGERNQLAQVVDNLIANAINYTPAGAVHVRTSLDPGSRYACLTVEDTGIGIDPDDMPHLFSRFYRGQQASKLGIPGTGLGLAIVKEIVDMHGGKIEVESVPGKGSVFRVCLPLAPKQT